MPAPEVRVVGGVGAYPTRYGLGNGLLGATRFGRAVTRPLGSIVGELVQPVVSGVVIDSLSAEVFSPDVNAPQ